MGDSPDNDNSGGDEADEVYEREANQITGNFGGDLTNLNTNNDMMSSPNRGGYASDEARDSYVAGQKALANKVAQGQQLGAGLNNYQPNTPSTMDVQDFARSQDFFDANPMSAVVDAPFTSRSADINVGPGDIFGLKEQIGNKISQGGTAVSNNMGQIVGATGQTPMFGIPFLPDVTTYTGRNEYNPFGDPTIGGDDNNNEPDIIRRRMSAETVPIQEEDDPVLSDDLASNYLQNPYYGYSGQGNLYQPYGYANNTLVDLLRTRNMTQPQQRAANLGLFGNPGDFS